MMDIDRRKGFGLLQWRKRGEPMTEFIKLVLLFFIYSFIGWLWETIYCSLKAGKFVYRGFLIGPYCPIYGFGILGVLYFVEPFQNNVVVLYVFATILVTTLEYFTSYLLEKLFHASWWDYRNVPLNINGRVAVPVSLFWGIACVLIVKVVNPLVLDLENWLAQTFGIFLPMLLLVLIAVDIVYTVTNMQSFQKVADQFSHAIDEKKDELTEAWDEKREEWADGLDEVEARLQQHREQRANPKDWLQELRKDFAEKSNVPKMSGQQRRFLKNYPNLRLPNVNNLEDIKQLLKEMNRK